MLSGSRAIGVLLALICVIMLTCDNGFTPSESAEVNVTLVGSSRFVNTVYVYESGEGLIGVIGKVKDTVKVKVNAGSLLDARNYSEGILRTWDTVSVEGLIWALP